MTSAAELPVTAGSNLMPQENTKMPDPLRTATGIYVTVHGHFYQPPRENPYLDAIERQPSAAPFHDWNERIHHECYRPNAFARVLNDQGELVGIVNNYEYLSFNIGATLMSWLERHDVEVYQRILEADGNSCDRLNGHGNAIAQVYNHIIMPLANEHDKYTQIRWGKEDFRSRFGRDPEGMWLAEAAVDYATLEALVAEGIRFIILAPSQAQRCRVLPTDNDPNPKWHEVGGSQIDPTRPYRCFLKGSREWGVGNGETDHSPLPLIPRGGPEFPIAPYPQRGPRVPHSPSYIDIFFYDGPISRDMGYSDVVYSSSHLAGRIGAAVRGDHRPAQLIALATDGETFGHHKGGTEKTLAYAFREEFPSRGWTVTNFSHYLSLNPPTWEVQLKPVTAWSCAHGVDRWQDDCGCGGGGGWHQQWRRPLRDTLNWLRDQLIDVYEEYGRQLFDDPWLARDEYVQVIRDRSPDNVSRFLSRHQTHKLTSAEQVDALRLLEMQRHALLMFTSCGWFFEEISRPEGTQILRYAARALELAGDVAGVQLELGFLKRLDLAPSNIDIFKNGAEVYRQQVLTAQVSFKQVAAHYAITSLFANHKSETPWATSGQIGATKCPLPYQKQVYCYTAYELDYQMQRLGSLTLAVGNLKLVSEITWESEHLVFAVLHLGGWDFHCCIQSFDGRRTYTELKEQVFAALQRGSAAHTILVMTQVFGEEAYSLEDLFAEERHRLMGLLSQETLTRLDQLYTQAYRENYGILMAFHRDELAVPQELQVAAEIALGYRCMMTLRSLEQDINEALLSGNHIVELEAIAQEAKQLRCRMNIPEGKLMLEQLILRSLWQLLHDPNGNFHAHIQHLERFIDVAYQLNLGISLERSQELYLTCLQNQIVPQCVATIANDEDTIRCRQLLKLGQKLAVDIGTWLSQLA